MSNETIARLHINLSDMAPEVWRHVDVPLTASLKMLQDIVQVAVGWENYHLWMFEAEGRRYGVPTPEWPERGLTAAKSVKLGTLKERGVRKYAKCRI